MEQKEELEQKHLHLLQILDSERQAKWHYVQQTEELATEVKKIRGEVTHYITDLFKIAKLTFCILNRQVLRCTIQYVYIY